MNKMEKVFKKISSDHFKTNFMYYMLGNRRRNHAFQS